MVSLVKRDGDVIFLKKSALVLKNTLQLRIWGVDYYKEIKLYGFL